MQVHKILVATLLAASAVGAMSQELDPGETLQAKNLAAPRLHIGAARSQELAPVVAAVRGTEANAPVQAPVDVAAAAPGTSWASRHFTHGYSKHWLHGDKRPAPPELNGRTG
jgi:hypothetical protein